MSLITKIKEVLSQIAIDIKALNKDLFLSIYGNTNSSITIGQGIFRNRNIIENTGGFSFDDSSNLYKIIVPQTGEYLFCANWSFSRASLLNGGVLTRFKVNTSNTSNNNIAEMSFSNPLAIYWINNTNYISIMRLNAGDSIWITHSGNDFLSTSTILDWRVSMKLLK